MRLSKKLVALAVGTGIVLTASAAFAYWTAGGSGSGSASTKSNISITLTGNAVSDLVPGISQNLTGTVDVSDGVASAYVAAITPSIKEGNGGTVWNTGCSADDFTLTAASHNEVIADNATNVAFGSIALKNLASTDQSGCKNQALVLAFSSN